MSKENGNSAHRLTLYIVIAIVAAIALAIVQPLPASKLKLGGEIFLRLLNGEVVSSESIPATNLTRSNFRTDEDWGRVQSAAVRQHGLESPPESIEIGNRYVFEDIKTPPRMAQGPA